MKSTSAAHLIQIGEASNTINRHLEQIKKRNEVHNEKVVEAINALNKDVKPKEVGAWRNVHEPTNAERFPLAEYKIADYVKLLDVI